MMKQAPAFVPRDGGFALSEIATHLRISVHRVHKLADSAGVRLRYVSMGKKNPRYGPVTVEEARAILLAHHTRRGT